MAARRTPAVVGAAILALFLVLANRADIATAAQNRATNGAIAMRAAVEVETTPGLPEAQRLTAELDRISVGAYRGAVSRFGSPLDGRGPDTVLVAFDAVRVRVTGPSPEGLGSCPETATLEVGQEVLIRTGPEPAVLSARRFGADPVPVRTVRPDTRAVVSAPGPTAVAVPWHLEIAGGCIEP